ncbi:MAG: conjugal transfer protein TraD [Candidatus Binatus sp.]
MADGLHTREQGLRVHHLANLGGLVAIAGLDREPPDLLLGGLLELAARLPDLPATRRAAIASAGRLKLDTRATSKRAWKSWSRSKELHSLALSSEHLRRIVGALGGEEPRDSAELPRMMLRLLGEETSDE